MRRRHAYVLAAFIALALITWLRIHLIDALPDQGYFAKYLTFADRIVAGQIPRDRLGDLSPAYLWLTVALRACGLSVIAIRTLQIIILSIAASFCAIAARRFGVIAMIAAPLLLLGSRAALVCATEAEPETLILFLVSAALAVLGDSQLSSGFLFGLAAICRPVVALGAAAIAMTERSWKLIASLTLPIVAMLIVNVALTGELVLMDPGTVFYEGMNPSATGYEGVQPRIVNEMERASAEPDYLHVAYRIVASRSVGRPLTRAESNRFWTGKAFVFVRAYPKAALRLTLHKLFFAIHSHDAYDLVTMARKDALLARYPFMPFGALIALAGAGVLLARDRRRELLPLVVFTLAGLLVLAAFYVTARQRNAILPALTVLAAVGVSEIAARRHVLAALVVAVIAVQLSIDGIDQIEDTNAWLGVRTAFDEAIALEEHGRWIDADRILAPLEEQHYRPIRENRAVSSVAFYRARAALHLGRDPRPFLDRASIDTPGNEHVLGLRARLGDRESGRLLFALHDDLTAQRAIAESTR